MPARGDRILTPAAPASTGRPNPARRGLLKDSAARSRSRPPDWAVAAAGYAALAVALTWPLALHLGDRFPGQRPDDAYGHYWNLWWFARALGSGQNPYRTPLWYPPEGTDLYLGTLAPLNGLLGLLPGVLAGPLVAYNALALLHVALAGLGGWLLGRRAAGHAGGAAVAGVATAASPFLLGQLNIGHLNVVAFWGAPLFAYALLRAADGSRRHILLGALALVVAALAEWQTAISALLIGGVLLAGRLLAALRRRAPWAAPARMIAAGALGGLLLLPLVIPTVRAIAAAGETARLGEVLNPSANLLAFFLPQELNPLWGDAIHQWQRANLRDPVTADLMPLGLTVLALAALGVVGSRRAALPWLIVLLLGMGLALGPALYIGQAEYAVPTPFALFRLLPYMNVSRNPSRYILLATLGAAVLAALGVRWLAERPAVRGRGWLVAGLAGLLVLGEQWPAPYPLNVPPDTAVARQVGREIAAADPLGAILPLPYKSYEQYILFDQVQHGRPIYSTGGAIERLPEPPLRANTPGFADLTLDQPYRDIFEPPADPLAVLNAFHVRYVLFYPDEVPERQRERYRRSLRRVLQQGGPAHVSVDGRLEAWRVPAVDAIPPFLRVGEGWHEVEAWGDGDEGRWMGGEANLELHRPQPAAATIAFTAVSYARPRRLEVRADGRPLGVFAIGTAPTEVALDLPPGAGATRLTLTSLDGTDSPQALTGAEDDRQLSVGLTRVRLTTPPP